MKIRDRIKELRRVRADEILPNPMNWRTHPKAQQDALKGVLAEIGFAGAVLARETPEGLMLIDGHLRTETVKGAEIPVLVLDVDQDEANKLLATLDPLAAMAEADATKLDELLRSVETSSDAVAGMLADLGKEAGCDWAKESGEVVEVEVPEPPVDPVTKPGDLWVLGEHRLLCGNSTKAEDVARLMAGEKADCVCTDPPYGIGVDKAMHKQGGTQYGKAAAPKRKYADTDWDSLPPDSLIDSISKFPISIIFGGNYFKLPPARCWLVWDKENGENAFADCELAWTNIDQPVRIKRHMWNGMIRKGKEERTIHPTQKPVEVMAWCLGMTQGNIYEPFCGSGTTLIAAEQLGRTCYGMEISPQYCDVIVSRWEKLTGKKARLEKTEQTENGGHA